ncbi:MAG: mandelate racemase/muconate lactonizing enzyme family protein [Casimicrobiaceae bacterium]
MKITGIETIQIQEFGNLVWVRIFTDQGVTGLGETFRNPLATIAYIHETCVPYLMGKDPSQIELHANALLHRVGNHFTGFPTRSVELRGNSAVDLALWDIAGKVAKQPVHQLLGGLCRDRIRIYNTCASPGYNAQARTGYNTELVRLDSLREHPTDPLDDLDAQMHDPAGLAVSLLDEGTTAMKIWPFDVAALETNGQHITRAELRNCIKPIEAIRKAVGDRMDIMLEFHGLWTLPCAIEIADAVADLGIYWYEDPISMQNFDDLAAYKQRVRGRVCGSEALGTTQWYRESFARGSIDVAHFDMCWIGGMTEGRKIASLAQAFDRPIAPHDCTGPLLLVANVHLLMSAPNALIAETVRAHWRGFYQDLVTCLPTIDRGHIHAMAGTGWGTELNPSVFRRKDLFVRKAGQCDE